MQITYDDSSGETTESDDESCDLNHDDYEETYDDEWNKEYFKPNEGLFGAKYRLCKRLFTHEPKAMCIMPSLSTPAYVCIGRRYKCKQAVYSECYKSKIGSEGRPKRKRKCRQVIVDHGK